MHIIIKVISPGILCLDKGRKNTACLLILGCPRVFENSSSQQFLLDYFLNVGELGCFQYFGILNNVAIISQ